MNLFFRSNNPYSVVYLTVWFTCGFIVVFTNERTVKKNIFFETRIYFNMATEEHLKLSTEIKTVHSILRKKTKEIGAKNAWHEHLKCTKELQSYAQAMKQLAVNHWERNELKDVKEQSQRNRILWSVNYCQEYFLNNCLITAIRNKEKRILNEMGKNIEELEKSTLVINDKVKLLDVGSCYNPFNKFSDFDVTAIDISPATDDVILCDFLNVSVLPVTTISYSGCKPTSIRELPIEFFDVIVFSLLLEYLPTSEQRIICCEKAYKLLKTEGVLIIITPDSNHVGINAKLMKNWRYTLALIGFNRIKYEKLDHIHCMVFRKAFDAEITRRWARIYKEDYMEKKIEIPQELHND